MIDINTCARRLGLTFHNPDLLLEAITHRSYLNENRSTLRHNERMEFLGDAVLELIVTDFLFRKFPNKPEGELTTYRSALVNTQSLAASSEKLNVNDILLLSKGESKDTGRARQLILANTFEAIIGAAYLDGGIKAATDFISKNIYPKIDEILANNLWQNAKSHFQETAQEQRGITPNYKTISEEGPDHDKCFVVGVFLNKECIATGEGKSKQEAEQSAANEALKKNGW